MKFAHVIAAVLIVGTSQTLAQTLYKLDPSQSYVSFEMSNTDTLPPSKFDQLNGSFTLDFSVPRGCFNINAVENSINVALPQLNNNLAIQKTIQVANYTGFVYEFGGNSPLALTGDLTLFGVTRKNFTFFVNAFECDSDNKVCTAKATSSLNPNDFGITLTPKNSTIPQQLGADIKLTVHVKGVSSGTGSCSYN